MAFPNSLQDAAFENLRIIRTLMERAHIYRAVSAPAALMGGLLAMLLAGYEWSQASTNGALDPLAFLGSWMALLAITSGLNFVLLLKDSRGSGQPWFSEPMKMALRAFLPPMLAGGVLGVRLMWGGGALLSLGAVTWILCYGLALLATAGFAPRSMVRLGWAFLTAGVALTLCTALGHSGLADLPDRDAPLFLGLTFGGLHLVYGVAVLRRGATVPVVLA